MSSYATDKRRSEGADEEGIFAIGFLGAAPFRVGREVDADASEVVAAQDAEFRADGEALREGSISR